MGIGLAILLYAIVACIQESMARARMRKGLEYVRIGLAAHYKRVYEEES
jgi:hypothetical protein